MTINKSKGLERKIVFVYSIDSHFDFIQAKNDDEKSNYVKSIEPLTRATIGANGTKIPNIMYVALTRAS